MQENPKPGVDVRESSVWGSAVWSGDSVDNKAAV